MRLFLSVLVSVVGLTVLSGCGGPTTAAVSGRVTYKGKAVNQATIIFAPVPKTEGALESGKPANGFSDGDGKYQLSTYKPFDGALIGKHKITVMLEDTNPVRCKRPQYFTMEVMAGDNKLDIELK